MMPWLYQLQQRSGEGIIFASLLIAAVPAFVIFSFCQNIIMRGIVLRSRSRLPVGQGRFAAFRFCFGLVTSDQRVDHLTR